MKNKNKDPEVLHCGPPFGGGGYRATRTPSLPIEISLVPIHSRTVIFSLPHACLAAGLLKPATKKISFSMLLDLANKKWGKSDKKFFASLPPIGISPDSIEKRARQFKGAVIGWDSQFGSPKSTTNLNCGSKNATGICADIELVLMVLSRRVSNLFLSSREPDYSWENLSSKTFEIDDERFSSSDLDSPPWNQFQFEE